MQCIKTKWIGPTDTKPGRIKAKADAGEVTIPWMDGGIDANHARAVEVLLIKLGWTWSGWVTGWIDDEAYHVSVETVPSIPTVTDR